MSYAAVQYRSARTVTASPLGVLIQLYEGAVRFLRRGRLAMERGDVPARAEALRRAHAIVTELQVTLEHEHAPELAAQLDALYDFVLNRITRAHIEQRPERLAEAEKVLIELLEAWRGVREEQVSSERGLG